MKKYVLALVMVSLCGPLAAMQKTTAELEKMETEAIEAEALGNKVDDESLRLKNDEQVLRGLIQDILKKRNSGFMVLTSAQESFVECCQLVLGINDVSPEKLIMRRAAVGLFILGMVFLMGQDHLLAAICAISIGMALFECSGYSAELEKSDFGHGRWYGALSRFLATMDGKNLWAASLFDAANNLELEEVVNSLICEYHRFGTIEALVDDDGKLHPIKLPDGDALQDLMAMAQAIKVDLFKK